jgi:hypothetical protein
LTVLLKWLISTVFLRDLQDHLTVRCHRALDQMVFGIVSETDAEIGGVNLTPKVSVHDAQRLPRQIWQKI